MDEGAGQVQMWGRVQVHTYRRLGLDAEGRKKGEAFCRRQSVNRQLGVAHA